MRQGRELHPDYDGARRVAEARCFRSSILNNECVGGLVVKRLALSIPERPQPVNVRYRIAERIIELLFQE